MLTVPQLLIPVIIGLVLGLIGGGGSVLTVPYLIYIVGQDTKEAFATRHCCLIKITERS
jgi:uncharacterized membrane protein YfcA